jgi:kynurenine formamidase
MKIVDLTAPWEEGMTATHPEYPRAPLLWRVKVHKYLTHSLTAEWSAVGPPPLYGGLPPDAAVGGSGIGGEQDEQVIISTQMGTHIDAPLHAEPNSKVDAMALPLERCMGSAVMLDFRALCSEPYAISAEDLDTAERESGTKVQDGDIVIIHTGWAARWGYGPNASPSEYVREWDVNPGLGDDAPPWFINRNVKLVGIDAANIDYDLRLTNRLNFLLQEAIGRDPILVVENLVNLDQLSESRFFFAAIPFPIKGGSGSPVRAIAVTED